jgi:TetR/AcrR family transcriptional regulator, fatty acid metabolism regulator protein
MSPRTVDRTARRAELVNAARSTFSASGVESTSIADIVRAAGVAQGTFYLYFESKDEVIVAVVEQIADQLMETLAAALGDGGRTPEERLLRIGSVFADVSQDRDLTDIEGFIHRPENQRLHDRFAERFLPRLVPFVEEVIRDGVEDGSFDVPDPHAATWFVLGALRGIELAGTPTSELPAALDGSVRLALRALGSADA